MRSEDAAARVEVGLERGRVRVVRLAPLAREQHDVVRHQRRLRVPQARVARGCAGHGRALGGADVAPPLASPPEKMCTWPLLAAPATYSLASMPMRIIRHSKVSAVPWTRRSRACSRPCRPLAMVLGDASVRRLSVVFAGGHSTWKKAAPFADLDHERDVRADRDVRQGERAVDALVSVRDAALVS